MLPRLFFWIGLPLGVSLLYLGVKMIWSGLAVGVGPVTDAERKWDYQLGDQIYQESLDRGDPEYMAHFYRADTIDMTDEEKKIGRWYVGLGIAAFIVGCLIVYGWWWASKQIFNY